MPLTRKDDGQRLVYHETALSEAEALDRLVALCHNIPEGWRIRVASLRCPTDRGRRVSIYLEAVSPEWITDRRAKRSHRQGGGAKCPTIPRIL